MSNTRFRSFIEALFDFISKYPWFDVWKCLFSDVVIFIRTTTDCPECYLYYIWTSKGFTIFYDLLVLPSIFEWIPENIRTEKKACCHQPRLPWRWGGSLARSLFSSSCRCWQSPGREGMRGQLQPGRGGGGRARMKCWSDQRWSHVWGETAWAGPGTGSGGMEEGGGSHRILWVKLLCWCWKYSQVQIMTFLGFKVSCQISFLKRFIFTDWVTPSHWDRWFHFSTREKERGREGGREGGGRGQAACGILIWCVDWEAGRTTLLLLNIILDNDNLNRNLPQLQWYFMRNQQRQSATVGEEINIKLEPQHINTSTTRLMLNNPGTPAVQSRPVLVALVTVS